ncbi:MAG: hypothetical protein SFV54_04970 [Bryobacteraceae bacterium]|nr:hypothetical protein [Bryobacteraceae bacterium]
MARRTEPGLASDPGFEKQDEQNMPLPQGDLSELWRRGGAGRSLRREAGCGEAKRAAG